MLRDRVKRIGRGERKGDVGREMKWCGRGDCDTVREEGSGEGGRGFCYIDGDWYVNEV